MAGRFGIAIIGEAPAAGLRQDSYFSQATLNHHKQVIGEMINRDGNHPAVLIPGQSRPAVNCRNGTLRPAYGRANTRFIAAVLRPCFAVP